MSLDLEGNHMKRKPRLLIANRGEIAIRIARTAKRLGITTIGIFTEGEEDADHLKWMDEVYSLGTGSLQETYLNIPKLVALMKQVGVSLVHPGYGFLSERAAFVQACEDAQIAFVGPTADSMERMGDKVRARETTARLGIPGVPGSKGVIGSDEELLQVAKQIGFPVLLKASSGGGGKGMRRVDAASELVPSFWAASREALSAFGDGAMYLEKLILKPHHVEIQVFGDGTGGGVHLGERECSIQRRHQKVWEESPSPILERHPETRPKMFAAALEIVKELRYRGAGTLEFIVDEEGNFFFLEMNTRLQVEHPVTEWVTGVDLVEWQLRLAMGEPVALTIPERRGSAIEVRVYAEDPSSFLPAPGTIGHLDLPSGPFVRVDSAFHGSGIVSQRFDPMILKLSVWGQDRTQALGRLRVALSELRVETPKHPITSSVEGSLKTNLRLLQRLCEDPRVLRGDTDTGLIAAQSGLTQRPDSQLLRWEDALAIALCADLPLHVASEMKVGSSWRDEALRERSGR
jgi:acetyl-CoA carboxylase biotin carboxylase subunit